MMINMQNELYQPNEYVVIRTPINSTEEFCHLFSNAKLTKQRIQNLKEDSCFRELLKTASHDLAQYFLDENAACTDKLLHSGIKYAIRSSSRCTPYGLCAGVSLAKLGEHTDILLGNKNSFVKFSRPDMEWLFSIIHKIISDKNILPSLKVCSNPYIYEKGSRLINPWHVDLAGVGSKETQISIRNSPLVQHVLSLSKSYILYDDLQHIILSESSTANESKVTSFINNLIDSEYLLVNLYPNLVNNNPLEHVINILQHIPTAKHWYEQLTEIKSLLNQYSSSSVGNSEAILNELFNKMQLLSPKKDYIQVDLKKPLAGSTLCNKVSNEAQKLITLLLSLSAKQETLPQIDTFKNQFIERYGYDVAVSILNVFDNDMGIGAPSGYAFPRSKQQISFSGTGETPLGKFLFYKVQYALRNNLSEISLSDDELKEFKSDIDITAAPNSVELSVCQRTPSSSSATAVRGFKNPKIFPKSLQAKAFPRPVCKLFQIHGSKFKPHPLRNAGQASHVGIAHRVFFFGICKDTLNRFLTFFVNALTQICFADSLYHIQILLPDVALD